MLSLYPLTCCITREILTKSSFQILMMWGHSWILSLPVGHGSYYYFWNYSFLYNESCPRLQRQHLSFPYLHTILIQPTVKDTKKEKISTQIVWESSRSWARKQTLSSKPPTSELSTTLGHVLHNDTEMTLWFRECYCEVTFGAADIDNLGFAQKRLIIVVCAVG